MNLDILQTRVNAKVYSATSAFISDVKWIVHNLAIIGERMRQPRSKCLRNICSRIIFVVYWFYCEHLPINFDCTIGAAVQQNAASQMYAAKNILKRVEEEMYDIETCSECFYKANTCGEDWFAEVCTRPHVLLWAKPNGMPFWPAKAMRVAGGLVDVSFFGEHDHAVLPVVDCYLFSKEDPFLPNYKNKRHSFVECLKV